MSEELLSKLEEIKREVVGLKTELLLTRFAVEQVEQQNQQILKQMAEVIEAAPMKPVNPVVIEKF